MTTECERVRTAILESFDDAGAVARPPELEQHVRGCASCQAFARRHDELDTQLAASLTAPSLSAAFRADLRRQIWRDTKGTWLERLPDIMHLGGCAVVVTIYATLVPADLPSTLLVGLAGTLATYAVMTLARAWFEDADCS